jgi:TIR domain/CHAT domain
MDSQPITKILFLAANPKNSTRLRLDEELREIDEGLRRSQQRDKFVLEQRWAVRPKDLQRAILESNPQIVHFSGHGLSSWSGTPLEGRRDINTSPETEAGFEGLAFEDDMGQTKLVETKAIADLFGLFPEVKCVVLNACYSDVQAKAISQHIPNVIGMNRAIGDKAAQVFAVGFYDALGAGRDIEFSFKLACNRIALEGIAENLTPQLIARKTHENSTSMTTQKTEAKVSGAIEVFFSYSHKDEELRDELATHLVMMKRQGLISAWYDRDIDAGDEWEAEILQRLNSARVILLLISNNFLASDFCYDNEMLRAMERHESKEARVIPIIFKPCEWSGAPFGKLQALPKNAKPITKWDDRDEAFLNVAQGIRRAVQQMITNT